MKFRRTAPLGAGIDLCGIVRRRTVKLTVPEMQVAAAPPPAQPVTDLVLPLAEEAPSHAVAAAIPAAAMPAARHWYYEDCGAQRGPVDEPVLRQMLATGQLDEDALVWNDGMAQWMPAAEVAGLLPRSAVDRQTGRGGTRRYEADDGLEDLCRSAAASRPWALFLAITAFIYAGLSIFGSFLMLVGGADKGIPGAVASGFFGVVVGVVTVIGGALLASYAGRLGSLSYRPSSRILQSAMDRLKTFWMFVSIVLIVILAFFAFVIIWLLAIGVSLAHYL